MNRFWMDECDTCGGSGGGIDPSSTCFSCRGTGLVEPDEGDIEAMREQEDDGWGRG